MCRLISIICRRDGNKTSKLRLSIFGVILSIPVDLLGSYRKQKFRRSNVCAFYVILFRNVKIFGIMASL